jgi:hypothetical protein
MRRFIVTATIALGAAAMMVGIAPTVQASEMLPAGISRQLDNQTIEFTMTEAKRERLMFIQENMNRQRYYGRGDGYGNREYGYGRRHGGPPPWAPAYGYRRNHYDRW